MEDNVYFFSFLNSFKKELYKQYIYNYIIWSIIYRKVTFDINAKQVGESKAFGVKK